MIQKQTFRAVIEKAGGGGAFVTIPFDVEKAYGSKRVKVKATIDGELYRGSLVRMGGSSHILGVLKEIRESIGKNFGDEVEITLEEDTEPRNINIPEDLMNALKQHPDAEVFFNQLSYSNKKNYVRWVKGAIRDQTRLNRVRQTVEMLNRGKKHR